MVEAPNSTSYMQTWRKPTMATKESIQLHSNAPNGLCINLSGPVEERRHDSRMLADSGLLGMLQRFAVTPDGGQLCIYGDPAYPHRPQLQAPFKAAMLTQEEKDWKKSMSQIRIQVEWMFGDNINYFNFLDLVLLEKCILFAPFCKMQGHVFMGRCQQVTLENYLQLLTSTSQ
eukprot:gene839-135_t